MVEPSHVALGVIVGILVVLFFLYQQSRAATKTPEYKVAVKPKVEHFRKNYTRAEVALHNKRDDAWIIVKDKRSGEQRVYDVTSYVDEHPGGESILNNAGRDSTEGFLGPQHPATVFVMVEEFCIGQLAQGE